MNNAIANRQPIIAEHEAADGSAANRAAIDEIKEWIINFTTNHYAVINMNHVYDDHCLQPTDGDMYDAFSELVREGILEGPDPYKFHGYTHGDYKYRRLPRVGDYCTYQVGSDDYAYKVVSVTKSGKSFEFGKKSGEANEHSNTTARRARDGFWYTKGGQRHGRLVYPGLNKGRLDPHF